MVVLRYDVINIYIFLLLETWPAVAVNIGLQVNSAMVRMKEIQVQLRPASCSDLMPQTVFCILLNVCQ